jgi:hypothetical protein
MGKYKSKKYNRKVQKLKREMKWKINIKKFLRMQQSTMRSSLPNYSVPEVEHRDKGKVIIDKRN